MYAFSQYRDQITFTVQHLQRIERSDDQRPKIPKPFASIDPPTLMLSSCGVPNGWMSWRWTSILGGKSERKSAPYSPSTLTPASPLLNHQFSRSCSRLPSHSPFDDGAPLARGTASQLKTQGSKNGRQHGDFDSVVIPSNEAAYLAHPDPSPSMYK